MILFAYLVFNPIAGRLKVLSYEESLQKEMLLVGILALANNDLYNNGSTPGSDLAPVMVIILIGLFLLSIKESKS